MANNRLEISFDLSIEKQKLDYEHGGKYICYNQPDIPTYRKPKQIVDRLLLNKKRSIALELKKRNRKLIEFSRFKDHQTEFLKIFKKIVGEAYYLIALNEFNTVCLIDIDQFIKLKNNLSKASFNEKDLKKIEIIMIPAKKIRKNYDLDLSYFKF
jgi:penicillin-binding protein-related factor A (putative recombinase)